MSDRLKPELQLGKGLFSAGVPPSGGSSHLTKYRLKPELRFGKGLFSAGVPPSSGSSHLTRYRLKPELQLERGYSLLEFRLQAARPTSQNTG